MKKRPLNKPLLSILIILCIPVLSSLLNRGINNTALTYMFAFNVVGAFLLLFNWQSYYEDHLKALRETVDTLLYMFVSFIFISIWLYTGFRYFNGAPIIATSTGLLDRLYTTAAALPAYSFVQGLIIMIYISSIYKLVKSKTDKKVFILLAMIVMAVLFSWLYHPIANTSVLYFMIYHVVLILILSGLYSLSKSVIPLTLSFGLVYLLFMIVSIITL